MKYLILCSIFLVACGKESDGIVRNKLVTQPNVSTSKFVVECYKPNGDLYYTSGLVEGQVSFPSRKGNCYVVVQ
jgi:hypothetical protein